MKHRAAAIEAPPGWEDTSGDDDWNPEILMFLSMLLEDLNNSRLMTLVKNFKIKKGKGKGKSARKCFECVLPELPPEAPSVWTRLLPQMSRWDKGGSKGGGKGKAKGKGKNSMYPSKSHWPRPLSDPEPAVDAVASIADKAAAPEPDHG